ncbi:8-oxo-dGTP diphosphatase [Candidatus Woesebacteria bacterium]|nr:8-oxo-dGTP diphosphatase [Candidatus Woesebacteria bacterium]
MKKGVTVYLVRKGKGGKVKEVCLGMKKIRYAKGKWNGFGGKVEKGETIKDAMVREVMEEAEVIVDKKYLIKMAELDYLEPGGNWKVYVFICSKWKGIPKETEEMRPKWFSVDQIPYGKMWENDKLWLSKILQGEKLKAKIVHDDEDRVVKYNSVVVENLK